MKWRVGAAVLIGIAGVIALAAAFFAPWLYVEGHSLGRGVASPVDVLEPNGVGDGLPVALFGVGLFICAVRLAFTPSRMTAGTAIVLGSLCGITAILDSARPKHFPLVHDLIYLSPLKTGAGVWLAGVAGLLAVGGGLLGLVERRPARTPAPVARPRSRRGRVALTSLAFACVAVYVLGHLGEPAAACSTGSSSVSANAIFATALPIAIGIACAIAGTAQFIRDIRHSPAAESPGALHPKRLLASTLSTVVLGLTPLVLFAVWAPSCNGY